MKKIFFCFSPIFFFYFSLSAQPRKIVNDLGSLTRELIIIKVQAEQIGVNIKKNWSSNEASAKDKNQTVVRSDTAKIKKDTSVTIKKDSSNTVKDSAKIDTTKNVKPVLTTEETSKKRIKDSLSDRLSPKYTELKAMVDGIIGQFEIIIKKPNAMNDAFKTEIQNSLVDLNKKLQTFINDYYSGSKLLVQGAGFNADPPLVGLLKGGISLYREIRNLNNESRQQVALDLEKKCALLSWDLLGTSSNK